MEIQSSDLAMEPKNVVEVDESAAPALLRLLDALEEHDDVNEVHANFDIPQEVLEKALVAVGRRGLNSGANPRHR